MICTQFIHYGFFMGIIWSETTSVISTCPTTRFNCRKNWFCPMKQKFRIICPWYFKHPIWMQTIFIVFWTIWFLKSSTSIIKKIAANGKAIFIENTLFSFLMVVVRLWIVPRSAPWYMRFCFGFWIFWWFELKFCCIIVLRSNLFSLMILLWISFLDSVVSFRLSIDSGWCGVVVPWTLVWCDWNAWYRVWTNHKHTEKLKSSKNGFSVRLIAVTAALNINRRKEVFESLSRITKKMESNQT